MRKTPNAVNTREEGRDGQVETRKDVVRELWRDGGMEGCRKEGRNVERGRYKYK